MKKGKIIIISGPSGSGKTTLYKRLLASKKVGTSLVKTVSVTTRPKRKKEKHGRDYFFVSLKMFMFKKRAGHFLETQQVFDNYYGTPKRAVQKLLARGKNVLLCIDVKGAKVVCQKFPKARSIFIKTPSLAVLKRRLQARGSENKEILALRLRIARQELKESPHYNYIVINDNLAQACHRLEGIILREIQGGRSGSKDLP